MFIYLTILYVLTKFINYLKCFVKYQQQCVNLATIETQHKFCFIYLFFSSLNLNWVNSRRVESRNLIN